MRSRTKLGILSIALATLVGMACDDDPATGTGGSGPGPAGPGVGPGPTSTATGMGPSTNSTGSGMGGQGGEGGLGPVMCDPSATHEELLDAPTAAENVDKVEQVGIWDEGDPLPPLP